MEKTLSMIKMNCAAKLPLAFRVRMPFKIVVVANLYTPESRVRSSRATPVKIRVGVRPIQVLYVVAACASHAIAKALSI